MLEVARAAGVSQSTVSHVINKTRRISPSTERSVRQAIESTGYTNDGVARSLRTGQTHMIGLAISAISNPYFGEVVRAMERESVQAGYALLLVDTHDDPEREREALSQLMVRRVDGVIVATASSSATALRQLLRRGTPTLLFDRVPSDALSLGIDAIAVENLEAVAALVDHLAEHGHRRIGLIAGLASLTSTEERVQGYRLGLERNGLEDSPALVEYGDSDLERIASAVGALIDGPDPCTALITGNNVTTISTMAALAQRGMEVPDDVALAAFDDFAWAEYFHPRLTAVRQPLDQLGRRSIALLLDRMADPDRPPRDERLTPELVIRDSCGPHVLTPGSAGAGAP
jgi:LacI family transcriptional regulator